MTKIDGKLNKIYRIYICSVLFSLKNQHVTMSICTKIQYWKWGTSSQILGDDHDVTSMKFVLLPNVIQLLPNISYLWCILYTTTLVCWWLVRKILPVTCSHINIMEWVKFGWKNFALSTSWMYHSTFCLYIHHN